MQKFMVALMNIDETNSGYVKKDLFMNLLECMDFQLDLKTEQALTVDNFACKGSKIKYRQVIMNMVINNYGPNAGTWSINNLDSMS